MKKRPVSTVIIKPPVAAAPPDPFFAGMWDRSLKRFVLIMTMAFALYIGMLADLNVPGPRRVLYAFVPHPQLTLWAWQWVPYRIPWTSRIVGFLLRSEVQNEVMSWGPWKLRGIEDETEPVWGERPLAQGRIDIR